MEEKIQLPKVVNFDYTKHLPQSFSSKTSDLFFILATLFIAADQEKELTKLTLEKVLFRAMEDLAIEKKYSFLNTYFYINTYGPHNNMFYKYLEELQNGGLAQVNGNNIYLSLKGINTISAMIENLSKREELLTIFIKLKKYVERYSGNDSSLAVEETHELQVKDATDRNRIKTIQDIIEQIQPRQQFRSGADFKYIDPFVDNSGIKKITIPAEYINKLEKILSRVKDEDYETEVDLSSLFAQ